MQPTLEIHPHQEFHFAENTDSKGCCFCWKSNTVRPKEYYVGSNGDLEPFKSRFKDHKARIVANQRLAKLVKEKFESDPINEAIAFDILASRVNHDFRNGDRITDEKLIAIINVIYQIRKEIHEGIL